MLQTACLARTTNWDDCDQLTDTAVRIMKERQRGTPMKKVLAQGNKDDEVYKALVQNVYKVPKASREVYSNKQSMNKFYKRFKKDVYKTCIQQQKRNK